jgi:hypothetical protein
VVLSKVNKNKGLMKKTKELMIPINSTPIPRFAKVESWGKWIIFFDFFNSNLPGLLFLQFDSVTAQINYR